jgi:hypothetical protein
MGVLLGIMATRNMEMYQEVNGPESEIQHVLVLARRTRATLYMINLRPSLQGKGRWSDSK